MDAVLNLLSVSGGFLGGATGGNYGLTILGDALPILEPLRLPAHLFNLASFALGSTLRLATPIADALQPAAKILVNTGYNDVLTPTDLALNPALVTAGFKPYDRTFTDWNTPTPFLSPTNMTPDEWFAVPGDVLDALIDGIGDSLDNLFTNGLFYNVPAPTTAAVPASVAAVPPSVAASLKTTPAPVQAVEDTPDNSGGGSSTASSLREEIAASGSGDDGSATGGSATGGNNSGGNNSGGGSNSGGSSSAGDASQAGGKSARKGVGGSKRAAAAKAADEKAAS